MMKPLKYPLLFLSILFLLFLLFLTAREQKKAPTAKIGACERLGVSAKGRDCYEDYLTSILKTEGAEAALREMKALEEKSAIVRTYCHGIAHTLGHAGYEFYGTLSEALSHGSMDCFAGYFHGVLEVALPEAADYPAAVKEACSGMSQKDGEFRFYQCVHGLGHGVTAYRQYDIEQALGDCDLLASSWQKESCWGGVFMENIDSKFAHAMGPERQGRLRDDGSDFWPCLSVGEEYRPACLRMITARILPKHGRDWHYTKDACDRLDVSLYRRLCFESYGRDAAGESLSAGLQRANELCDMVPGEMRDTCYETAAAVVATHFADPERAEPICARAGESRNACERGKERIAKSLAGRVTQ